jgi:hypothetical protein
MTAALALLLGALVAGRLAPALLGRADLTRVDPLAVLTGWLLSAAGVLAATVAGVACCCSRGTETAPAWRPRSTGASKPSPTELPRGRKSSQASWAS